MAYGRFRACQWRGSPAQYRRVRVRVREPEPGLVGMRGARWVTAGLADQFVIACANAGNTVLALALLSLHRSGIMILSLGLAYFVMFINRAFVGDVLLALASRYDG